MTAEVTMIGLPSNVSPLYSTSRRTSFDSTHSSNETSSNKVGDTGSNPLMQLADAALSPRIDEVVKCDETQHGEGLKDPNASSKLSPPSLNDSKVVKGSLLDLTPQQEKKASFAEYLMDVLNNEENNDILRWMPCGTQFTITDHRKFTMERMPELFKIRNMSSFVRKLTRWGFARVHEKESGNSDIFKHPCFLRDCPELCKKIRCVNRANASNSLQLDGYRPMHRGSDFMIGMGNLSESSRCASIGSEMYMMTPHRRSINLATPSAVYVTPQAPQHRLSPPFANAYGASRVSPEYEKEMMSSSTYRSGPRMGSPHNPIEFSAAAEYELEQILLQRQQARLAAYNQAHGCTAPPSHLYHVGGKQLIREQRPLRTVSERRLSDRSRSGLHPSEGTTLLNSADVVTNALETLQREGDYDLDMSPREAMLRAVLHKRQQQQRAAATATTGSIQGRTPSSYLCPPSQTPMYHHYLAHQEARGPTSFYR